VPTIPLFKLKITMFFEKRKGCNAMKSTLKIRCWLKPAALLCVVAASARGDEITDWNQIMFQAARTAVPPTSPGNMTRVAAIVQTSVFDAVNGIERRYMHLRVQPNAPAGASQRAAAVQAAYASLVRLYPSQTTTFDLRRSISLAGIASSDAVAHSQSIARGIEWGQKVADEIWAWRLGDGFSAVFAPFTGGSGVGQWRPTPPANAPGIGLNFRSQTPWVLNTASQFRPAGPPALTSANYANDFNETKLMGKSTSAIRTADQTLYAAFWAASTSNYSFNQVAVRLAAERHLTLSESSRLLALVNIAMADALIGCFDAKYEYTFWRPVTAIPLAATDGNAATDEDATWAPLLVTPPHPEYPSAHSCMSGAAGRVLATYYGDDTAFSLDSDVMLGVIRSFTSFSQALDEVKNARIYAGIHFRTACDDGQTLGINVADFTLKNFLLPLHGELVGQIHK
jgi:hypothetical protein